jgi:hypothetical protein
MGYYRKNKRRFDARYFLNERVENPEVADTENSVQKQKINFHDFSFDSWILEEAERELEESNCSSHKRDSDKEGKGEVSELVVPGPEPKMSSRGAEFIDEPFPGGSVEDLPSEDSPCGKKKIGGGYRVSSRFGELTTPDRSRESLNAAASFAMHLIQNMGLSDEEMEMSPEVLDVVAPTRMEEG